MQIFQGIQSLQRIQSYHVAHAKLSDAIIFQIASSEISFWWTIFTVFRYLLVKYFHGFSYMIDNM